MSLRTRRAALSLLVLLAVAQALSLRLAAHDIPADTTVRAFIKPDGQRLRFIVRVPLSMLGTPAPDFLFTATRAGLGEVSADDTAWHLFSLSNDPGKGHNTAK